LRADIRQVTDRDLLRSLGEKLRALPPDRMDAEEGQLLPEEAIEERSSSLIAKLDERWGFLIADREDGDSFERCRHSRDEFDSLFQEWSKRQSEEMVRQLEEKMNHWKQQHQIKTGHGETESSSINELEASINEILRSLPEEMKGHYRDKLAELKQEAATQGE
jgi:DNA anti-recombination protein RmuC